MIEFVFHKVSRLLTEYAHILNDESEKKLLNKIKSDLSSYQFINFYAVRVDLQCDNKLKMIDDYLQDIGLLERKLRRTPSPGHEITFLINELKATLISLAEKKAKILRLKAKIPEGILDTKRALFVANADALSYSTQEDTKLKTQLDALKEFMKGANRAYNVLIRQGGTLSVILYGITALYWIKLHEFRVMLTQTIADVESSDLTPTGKLAQRSLVSALGRIPSIEQITPMLQLTTDSNERRSHISFKPQSSFYSIDGRKICSFLQQSNKLF